MTTPSTSAAPVDTLPEDLQTLLAAIGELPHELRTRVETAAHRVVENTRRRRRILALVQESMGQLRLDMKYLIFDLEATRRERDELRRQAGEQEG